MKALVQRVSRASVTVKEGTVGEIGRGFLVLVGVEEGDAEADADYLARKVAGLRVFEDADAKMNLALDAVGGAVLAVSQFTLCADTTKGNRPSFQSAAPPEVAERLFERFVAALERRVGDVATGVFGAHMDVELVNDGPVTIMLESRGGQ